MLVALLFPLYLVATNADQWVDLSVVWGPLALCVAGGAALCVACAALFGGWRRGGLVATLLLVLFFTFGHTRLALAQTGVPLWLIAVAWVGLAVLGLTLIGRGRAHLDRATTVLNTVAAILVVFNLATLGAFWVGQAGQTIGQRSQAVPLGDVGRTPDIYYLVFDRYAGEPTLREFFDFDNEPFLTDLESRGFAVARDAWANYGGTALSLVASLSMNYLDGDVLGAIQPVTYGAIHAALRGHLAVPETVTSIGYEYIHIGNWWEPGTTNVDADEVLVYRHESEFATALLETTALSAVAGLGPPSSDPEVSQIGSANRAHTLFELAQVTSAASRPGPTYVFAHFLIPHPPYVFNADGSAPTETEAATRTTTQSYVEQLQWTNGQILALVDHLMDVPPDERPVIVVQADEGPYPPRYEANQDGFPWLEATPAEVRQKFGILNAMYLPGVSPAEFGFGDRTSPVNEFRIIFDAYFGAELPLLDDRTYLSPDKAHLYSFTRYERPD